MSLLVSGPYIRIVQMNQSGKVVKKKKTVFQVSISMANGYKKAVPF